MAATHTTLLIVLFLWHTHVYAKNRLLRDGFTSVPAFEKVTYNAVNYIPMYGNLGLVDSTKFTYYNNTDYCHKAMTRYRGINDLSGLFDSQGTITNTAIGLGQKMCLCFSLVEDLGMMDMCLGIDGDASIMETCCEPEDVGVYRPGNKALPQCKAVSTSDDEQPLDTPIMPPSSSSPSSRLVVSSSSSSRGESSPPSIIGGSSPRTMTSTPSSSMFTTVTSSTMVLGPESSAASGPRDQERNTLSQSDKLALGVGLGMVSIPTCIGGRKVVRLT